MVSPSLMPFRIAHSGHAPISTYFLAKPFLDEDEKRRMGPTVGTTQVDSGHVERAIHHVVGPTGDSERVKDVLQDGKDALVGPNGSQPFVEPAEKPGSVTNRRLEATFRGRRVVSEDVLLPDGFTGLLLTPASGAKSEGAMDDGRTDVARARNEGKAKTKSADVKAGDRAKAVKAKAAAKSGLNGKGRSRKVFEQDAELVDEEEIELENGLVTLENDETAANGRVVGNPLGEDNVFEVAGKFQRFTLWHPDIPVDEARDEYVRSLKEWVALASEVCF